jgi:hypothetical protein
MEKESSLIFSIIFIAIFLVVFLLGLVLIIGGLNQGNTQAGNTISGNNQETLYNIVNEPQTLQINNLSNVRCTINQVSVHGYIIPMSNLTINNCQIAYTP